MPGIDDIESATLPGIVYLVFLSSSMGCTFLLYEWAREKLAKSDQLRVTGDDLIHVAVIFFIVIVIVEVVPDRGAVTRIIYRSYRRYNVRMSYLLCIITTMAHRYLMNFGPWGIECLFFGLLILSVAFYIALNATRDVSYKLSRLLTIHQGGLLLQNLIKGDYLSAITCGITCSVCWIVMVFRLAELKSPRTR